ncbi:MAG: hypothetical protein ABR991_06295 [Terracidiphilus sp.]|jgi:hypothetical protein
MKHLSEEELIDHFYSKDKAGKQHLANCAECAEAYAALEHDLAALPVVEPPFRDASYGEQVWESIAPSLPAYVSLKRSWLRVGLWRGLSYAAACAFLVACAFFAGRQWEHRQPHATVKNTPSQPQPAQRVVLVVLSDHLDRSERLLVELKHADAGSAEMLSPLRDEARSLQAANRICRQNVHQDDDPALATALDRLDHVLTELVNQPGGLNAATLSRLQKEMNADGLLFEVRVLRSRIPEQQTAAAARSNGGNI